MPGGAFTFGFNSKQPSHDVDWLADDGVRAVTAEWDEPVGMGAGPVHGPRMAIPAVTEWGMAVMVLLVLAAGTVVIKRARALKTMA